MIQQLCRIEGQQKCKAAMQCDIHKVKADDLMGYFGLNVYENKSHGKKTPNKLCTCLQAAKYIPQRLVTTTQIKSRKPSKRSLSSSLQVKMLFVLSWNNNCKKYQTENCRDGAEGTKKDTPPSNQDIYSKDGWRKLDFLATLPPGECQRSKFWQEGEHIPSQLIEACR